MCVLESFCQCCWDAQESMTLIFIHWRVPYKRLISKRCLKIQLSMFPNRYCSNVKTRYQPKKTEKLFPSYILTKPYVAIHCISPFFGWGGFLTSALRPSSLRDAPQNMNSTLLGCLSDWWDATPVVSEDAEKTQDIWVIWAFWCDDDDWWWWLMMIDDDYWWLMIKHH